MSESPETREMVIDERSAYLTFDALERVVVWAVDVDEMEVAAEYLETLMLQAAELDDWHSEYMDESEVLAMDDPEIGAQQNEVVDAIRDVQAWAFEHDHDVARWFDE